MKEWDFKGVNWVSIDLSLQVCDSHIYVFSYIKCVLVIIANSTNFGRFKFKYFFLFSKLIEIQCIENY